MANAGVNGFEATSIYTYRFELVPATTLASFGRQTSSKISNTFELREFGFSVLVRRFDMCS